MSVEIERALDNARKALITIMITIHLALSGWLLSEIHTVSKNQVGLLQNVKNLESMNSLLIEVTIKDREREMEHLKNHNPPVKRTTD